MAIFIAYFNYNKYFEMCKLKYNKDNRKYFVMIQIHKIKPQCKTDEFKDVNSKKNIFFGVKNVEF